MYTWYQLFQIQAPLGETPKMPSNPACLSASTTKHTYQEYLGIRVVSAQTPYESTVKIRQIGDILQLRLRVGSCLNHTHLDIG